MATRAQREYQRRYHSRPGRKPRLKPRRSAYELRHLETAVDALELPVGGGGKRVLELGCGMGRFTHLLLERGFQVTATDLSPDLLAVLASTEHERLRWACCDAAEVDRYVEGPFDAAVGFFVLHHLAELAPAFRSLARTLGPGAPVAFIEPNAFNPLFYFQILLTPGMTWRGDRGVVQMRPGRLTRSLREAGFTDLRIRRYGMFPPRIANHRIGAAVERWLERRRILDSVLAFQVVSGRHD